MKNLFKFTAAAVALFAFASCSDDISEFSNSADFTAANELKIEAEEMDGGNLASSTRTAYVGTTNARVWQETDEFKVFGPQVIGMYDYYKFSKASNKFLINGTKDLETAAFVGFPKTRVIGQNWDKETKSAYLEFEIPAWYDAYDEVSGTNPVAYVSNLPLWGTAEDDGDGIKAKVYFLTAIVKISLENAADNATDVRIAAYKNVGGTDPAIIAGRSYARLSENGTAYSASDVQLPAPEVGANEIRMDLGDLSEKAQTSVIYLPLIAGTYGCVKVQYSTDHGTTWTSIQEYLNKEFKRGTCYGKGNTHTFSAAVTTVNGLNDLLGTMTKSTGELEIKGANNITVGATGTPAAGNNIEIPAMPNVTKLTLDFDAGKKFVGAAATQTLTISGDYAGTLVLDAGFDGNVTTLNIATPKANVVLGGGTWASVTTINFNYAKDIQFGGLKDKDDKEIAADFTAVTTKNYEADVKDIYVAEKATGVGDITLKQNHVTTKVDVKGACGSITVPDSKLAATTAITVSGEASDVKATLTAATDVNNATVEISGIAKDVVTISGAAKITGTAKSVTTTTGIVEISGKVNYSDLSTKASAAKAVKVNTVSAGGNVTINLDNEGAAIGTSLTFTKPATLTLTQGYVKDIIVNSANATDKVTITLGDEKYAALTKLTETNGVFEVSNTPKWNGQKVGGSIATAELKKAITDAELATAAELTAINWSGYKEDKAAVYTGIGLADNATQFTLKNNIDLNKKAWAPATSAGDIDGGGFTIKNLTVAVPKDGDAATVADAGLGLFATLANDVTNLTLDGVTIAAVGFNDNSATPVAKVVTNIGALAGKLTDAKEIKYVTIKNIALSSTKGGGTIGGVIGTNTAKATLTGVTVSGTNTIQGYGNLGGLIGYAGAAVDIQKIAKGEIVATVGKEVPAADVKSAAAVSFTANFNSEETNDLTYKKVGNFIGSIGDFKVTVTDAADVKPTLTNNTSIFTGTMGLPELVGDKLTIYNIVSDKQTLIGYSGKTALTAANLTLLNTKQYPIFATTTARDAGVSTAEPNYLYYIDKE